MNLQTQNKNQIISYKNKKKTHSITACLFFVLYLSTSAFYKAFEVFKSNFLDGSPKVLILVVLL